MLFFWVCQTQEYLRRPFTTRVSPPVLSRQIPLAFLSIDGRISLREYWGRRHSRIVGTILKESIFQPSYPYVPSRLIVPLITFIVSGLLQVHIVLIVSDNPASALSAFAFFLLQGLACCLETCLTIRLLPVSGWFITHVFLLLTAPLAIGPFTRQGPVFLMVIEPALYDNPWVPKNPTPLSCPQ